MIKVETEIKASLQKVWESWTQPEHIVNWNFANDDWHCPKAENDLKKAGKFSSTMAAKDGSFSFDFCGTHVEVQELKSIESVMGDGRKMKLAFSQDEGNVKVMEEFEPESENPVDFQKAGWQAILDNFKKYVESFEVR